jgi:hypothetical protein
MRKQPKASGMTDLQSKEQITSQEAVMDTLHVAGEKFLVCIGSPLELTTILHFQGLSWEILGTSIQSHMNTVNSKGFKIKKSAA